MCVCVFHVFVMTWPSIAACWCTRAPHSSGSRTVVQHTPLVLPNQATTIASRVLRSHTRSFVAKRYLTAQKNSLLLLRARTTATLTYSGFALEQQEECFALPHYCSSFALEQCSSGGVVHVVSSCFVCLSHNRHENA